MMRKRYPLLVVALLVVFLVSPVLPAHAATVRHVAPGGTCNGATPCYGSLQDAVNSAVSYDEIRVAAGTYSQVNTGGGITAVVRIVNRKLTLRGGYSLTDWTTSDPVANPTTINPAGAGIGVFIDYNADTSIGDVIIDGFTITGGSATDAGAGTDSGGAIYIDGTAHVRVTVRNCDIHDNSAEDGSGGGIKALNTDVFKLIDNEIYANQGSGLSLSYGANPTVTGNYVHDNAGDGLGFYSTTGSSTDIRDNTVEDNQGSGITLSTIGGGSVTGNTLIENHAEGGGGGLDISGAYNDVVVSGNTIRDNVADVQGGGIDVSGSIMRITDNLIELNTVTAPSNNGGGGLYVNSGASGAYVLLSGNRVFSNTTSNQGGGIVAIGEVDIVGNTIRGNSGGASGGGIVATTKGQINDNVVIDNVAGLGGGIRVYGAYGLTVDHNWIHNNRATTGDGGGMSLSAFTTLDLTLDGNQVISNTAADDGGGIYVECPNADDMIDIANTVLARNAAGTGSGLYSSICSLNLAYSTVASNGVGAGDGRGIYLRDPLGADAEYHLDNTIVVSQTTGVYAESGAAFLEATFWGTGGWANGANTGGGGTVDTGTYSYTGDPLFVVSAGDDYHIQETSPVIDKGVDTWITVDMDGLPRPTGATDIGADEWGELEKVYLPLVVSGS